MRVYLCTFHRLSYVCISVVRLPVFNVVTPGASLYDYQPL
jgi:hypothetical protein